MNRNKGGSEKAKTQASIARMYQNTASKSSFTKNPPTHTAVQGLFILIKE